MMDRWYFATAWWRNAIRYTYARWHRTNQWRHRSALPYGFDRRPIEAQMEYVIAMLRDDYYKVTAPDVQRWTAKNATSIVTLMEGKGGTP